MSEAALVASSEGSAVLSIDAEFKNLIPPLSPEERAGLEASIVAEGCRDAIVTWDGVIVDGHNRYEICRNHGIAFRVDEKEFGSRGAAILWIIDNQLARRNITKFVRLELLEEQARIIGERAKRTQGTRTDLTSVSLDTKVDTLQEIADAAKVGRATVARAKKIREKAPEEVKDRVRSGEISINEAYKEIRTAERVAKKQATIEKIETLSQPNGLYHVLVVDPPWQYEKEASAKDMRGRPKYPTMPIEEILAMEIPAEDDAVLWLWTTNSFMHEAYHILDAWGFTPKTILTWVKDRMGMGDWLRGKTEHCILAVRGDVAVRLTNQTTVLEAPLREHSRKPDEFYALVDALCVGKKIDIFSREKREGWDQWGGEPDEF